MPGTGSPPTGLSHWEGEPVAVWEALWGVPLFEAYETLGSTNDRVRDLAREGALPFTVVTAEEQTRGRGRSGRRWASAPGKGLWISALLRLPAAEARLLAPVLVGVAVCRALESVAPELEATVKWPNDVLLGERKVCGILCEAASGLRDRVVAGVGLNVRHRPPDFPEAVRASAVSVAMATGRQVSRSALAGHLVAHLRRLLSRPTLRIEGALASELQRRDALRGRQVRIRPGGAHGVAMGIDPGGALRIRTPPGPVVRVVAGSVRIGAG